MKNVLSFNMYVRELFSLLLLSAACTSVKGHGDQFMLACASEPNTLQFNVLSWPCLTPLVTGLNQTTCSLKLVTYVTLLQSCVALLQSCITPRHPAFDL